MSNHSAPAPVFELATSPLYASNDGRLAIERERDWHNAVAGFIVVDTTDKHVELYTRQREVADAFIAGYDYAERLAANADAQRTA